MSELLAVITYYLVIITGYVWAVVQLAASEPFDALILFAVTLSFQAYRNAVVKEAKS